MAIDRTETSSLIGDAPDLRLSGDIETVQAIPIELQKIILQYWIQQGDGSPADRIEDVPKKFRDNILGLLKQASAPERSMDADEGIARLGYKAGGDTRIGFFTGMREQEQREKERASRGPRDDPDRFGPSPVADIPTAAPSLGVSVHGGKQVADIDWARMEELNQANKTLALLEADKEEEKVERFRSKQMGDINLPGFLGAGLNLFKGPFQKGSTATRNFFLDKVLRSNKQYIRDLTAKYGNFYDLTEDEKEKFYQEYMSTRLAGDIDAYGNPLGGGGDEGGPKWSQQGYPSYAAWMAAQQTGGITDATATTTPATTTTTTTPTYPAGWNPLYHIGGGATQEQIDYMQNVLGISGQTYAAQGGRVPAAFGGIMDTATGRRGYGLGSIFKKITKPFKKLLKSKAGKIGLMALLGIKGPAWLKDMGLGSGKWLGEEGVFKSLGSSFMKDPVPWILGMSGVGYATADKEDEVDPYAGRREDLADWEKRFAGLGEAAEPWYSTAAQGGRIGYADGSTTRQIALNRLYGINDEDEVQYAQEGGLMNLGGMEKDYRQEGGFVPIGGQEKADDVPARLSKNEFVFTADAVRAAGGGDIDAGAEIMENVMENLEQGGQVSEESQGLEGARNMFATAKRLEGVL